MGKYLDKLRGEFDEITTTNTEILDRAADGDRELTDDEQKLVERADTRRDELAKAIEHYAEREARDGKVAAAVAKLPAPRVTNTVIVEREAEAEYDITRDYPTVGHYAIEVHRATFGRDRDAAERLRTAHEKLERATAHQTTADNPGLIPRPIVGPLINLIDASRPFISSVTPRPLTTGKFDRPKITQHVAVGKQAAEKDQTASQKLLINNLPVSASTYAGHLNISRQDIKWTSPAILSIVFDDFAAVYAQESNADAVAQFVASVTAAANETPIDTADAGGIARAMFGAAAASLRRVPGVYPDTQWVSADVWAMLGGMVNNVTGALVFPSLSLTNSNGNPMGLRLVMDPNFPDGTWIMGPSRATEWYEDVDGLLQVQEPDVLGQLVGYAGYGALLNTEPEAYTTLTPPVAGP